jgi:hypothetical protein
MNCEPDRAAWHALASLRKSTKYPLMATGGNVRLTNHQFKTETT